LRKRLLQVCEALLCQNAKTREIYFRYIEPFMLYLHLEHSEVWRVMEVRRDP
jgi:hypothetical protein